MSAEAYPLQWPEGWPRTKTPRRARFNTKFARARDALMDELRLMNAKHVVLSTNVALRRDSLPYANQAQPADTGVAVYWREPGGDPRCIACDRWDRVEDNIQALRLTIAALRGLNRWGSSEIVSRAFTGFARLEAPPVDWRAVLDVSPHASLEEVRQAYQRARRTYHPDRGGDVATFQRVNDAWAAAQRELTGRAP